MSTILIREGKGRGPLKNIGDYVQSIAQRQFLEDENYDYADIEELSDFKSDKPVKLIMNGWFTWNCKKFLPPESINPLFISFHLTPPKEMDFFTPEIISYLKKHEPIGARDMLTMELMKKHGIDSYFSGCLTLTLGIKYKQDKHDGGIYIVDPYLEFGGDSSLNKINKVLRTVWYFFKNYKKTMVLKKKYICQHKTPFSWLSAELDHLFQTATFYEIYSKRFDDSILLEAEYLTALVDNNLSNDEKFRMADEMLKKYAKAKFVLTSRLHVSFPCIAVGTKNIFVMPSIKTEEKDVKRYSGRLKGLDDTVHIMEYKNCQLYNSNSELPEIISSNNVPNNKDGYLKYRKLLLEKIDNFLKTQ